MIWDDMSYNRYDGVLNRLQDDNDDEDDSANELDEAGSTLFRGNGCVLQFARAVYSQEVIEALQTTKQANAQKAKEKEKTKEEARAT